jgi:glycosyltransferase involved in cell wall biosynthesis
MVLEKYPRARFVCPDMQGEVQAEKWSGETKMGGKVELLPEQSPQQMAELFQKSQISVSITTHDGTPNTLLEAMACGCFPIAGDIESLHEWIAPGVNGLLVDPGNPKALAEAILSAIAQPELRSKARERNLQLVRERAEYRKVMKEAVEFYSRLVKSRQNSP